ncbi:Ccc1 family [Nemania diffusa]|nr:Ccc1 family [Nemania diffusa]
MELLAHLLGWRERRIDYETFANSNSDTDSTSDYDRSRALKANRSLSRHLADFTLGFSDGLTVPFALTTGLSSLGETGTVIKAGTAELFAGAISMGIGGYLAAKGEQRSDTNDDSLKDDEYSISSVPLYETQEDQRVSDYLAPLQLPPDLLQSIMVHAKSSSDIASRLRDITSPAVEPVPTSPIFSGLSVALGYLIGGLLPLAPYFFVRNVDQGQRWSLGICLVALFLFGFAKEYILDSSSMSKSMSTKKAQWRIIKRSLWEGITMVILGGLAALAAVLAVRFFSGGAA